MKKLTTERTMTVSEVASALNVSTRTVQRLSKKLNLTDNIVVRGQEQTFNEKQVTLIKLQIGQGRTDLENINQVSTIKTELEKTLIIRQAISFLNETIETLQIENETMKPKAIEYDKFMASDDAQPMGDVAKLFKIGKNKLFEKLRNDKILMRNNTPYQKYMKYFVVIEKLVNEKLNTTVTLVNSKGIDYISNRYFKDVK